MQAILILLVIPIAILNFAGGIIGGIWLAILGECASISAAEGYPVREEAMTRHRNQLTAKGSTSTASMLRDTENGGRTEADHVLGAMLALAKKHGLAAPLLEIRT